MILSCLLVFKPSTSAVNSAKSAETSPPTATHDSGLVTSSRFLSTYNVDDSVTATTNPL
nr:MAG TPA: hypothetical protein [Crassvirales sp.]